MKICPVIMAGGVGSRFWPESRERRPKQLLEVVTVGETLIQSTFKRIKEFAAIEDAGAERLAAGLIDGLDAPARARWPLDAGAEAVRGAGVKA